MEQGKCILKFGTDGDHFCWIWDIWYWLWLRSALQGFFISFHTIPYKVVSLFLHNGVFSVTRTLLPDWEQEPTVIIHALAQKCRSCEHRLQVFMYIISKCTTVEHTWAWLSACFQRRCCVDVRVRCCVMKFLCDGVNPNRDDFTHIYFPGLTVGCCWTLSFTNRNKATKSSVWASCYDCATYFHISHRCSCRLRVKLDQLDYI